MKHSSLVKDKSQKDICFTIFMALVWSDTILLRFARVAIMKMPVVWVHADMMISLALAAILIFAFPSIYRVLYIRELFITLAFYGVYFLYFCIFPLNREYYSTNSTTVLKDVFPMFLIGVFAYRIERERTIKILNVISLFSVVLYTGYMILYHSLDDKTMHGGDMHAAYLLLPHLCMVFYSIIRKAVPWNIVAFAIGTAGLLLLGNRGSLLCLGLFAIFTILFSGGLKRPVLFLALAIVAMVVLFSFGVLDSLYGYAEENGLSLRIFEKLESGELTDSSGRDKLSERIIEYIMLYPMMGMGIFSDRRVAGGFYAHNIFLEMVIHYGMILGILLLAMIIYLLVVAFLYLRKNKDVFSVGFFTSLIFSCIIKLFLSSSYIIEPYFFFTIGFAYAAINERRHRRLTKNGKESKVGPRRKRRFI